MSETPTETPKLPQVMPTGGQVVAVVPQSVEEIFRVSKGVVQSGLAPYALTGKLDTAEAITKAVSAVAIVIMAGAELGLPPMVSLRSFTAINGRPALYGDGLINVVRRSGRAKEIKVGFVPAEGDDPYGPAAYGFCRATRIDTGESDEKRFTVAQAKRAGLWQGDDKVWKVVWSGPKGNRTSKREQVQNDSPWYRYPERMLGWRAAGFCLRELFGDVLGGITDDWEAREISGMVDISPSGPTVTKPATLPDVPPDGDDEPSTGGGDPALHNSGLPEGGKSEETPTIEGSATASASQSPKSSTQGNPIAEADFVPTGEITPEIEAELAELTGVLSSINSEGEIEEQFDAFDAQARFAENQVALAEAFTIKRKAIDRLAEIDGFSPAGRQIVESLFGGELPEVPDDDDLPADTRAAVRNLGAG